MKNEFKKISFIVCSNVGMVFLLLVAINFGFSLLIPVINYFSVDQEGNQLQGKPWIELSAFAEYEPEYVTALQMETESLNSKMMQFAPFIGYNWPQYDGKYVSTNAVGERNTPESEKNEPGKLENRGSVLFFGGSTMWGYGAGDHETIPAFIKNENPKLLVHNYGQLAYTSRNNLARLVNLANQSYPLGDVIFYDGINDALYPTFDRFKEGHKMVNVHSLSEEFWSAVENRKSKANSFGRESFTGITDILYGSVLRVLKKFIGDENGRLDNARRFTPLALEDLDYANAVADAMLQNWQIAHDIVKARGGKFYAILQPHSFVGDYHLKRFEMGSENYDTFVLMYSLFDQKIKELNLPWIYNQVDIFDDVTGALYIDRGHLTGAGNRIVAEHISEILSL